MASKEPFDKLGTEYLIDSLNDSINELNQHINLFSLYHTVILTVWITVVVSIGSIIISVLIASRWDLLIGWLVGIIVISVILLAVLWFLQIQISTFASDKSQLLNKLEQCRKIKAKIDSPKKALFEEITQALRQKRPKSDYTIFDILAKNKNS